MTILKNCVTENQPVLAVDLGGTKVAVALVSPQGQILEQIQEPTCQTGPDDGIDQIARLLQIIIDRTGIHQHHLCGIGIGIPAVLEPETDFVIWGPNLNGWRNVALRPQLESRFGLPVCVEYDGHTAALGEWWMGSGRGKRSAAVIIIGTGVGGGLILDGRLVRGMNRLAGAVGWFALTDCVADQVEENQRDRSLGFWEARTAGPGIALRARQLMEQEPGIHSSLAGKVEMMTARDVFEAAQNDDAFALRIANETADLLGIGIANVVSLVNPEVVILGGSVGANAGFLIPRISEVVQRYAQPISGRDVEILPSRLGGEAGLLGAAYGLILRLNPNL